MRSASVGPSSQLEDERLHAAAFFQTVDGRDIRVVQRGEELRLRLNRSRRSGSDEKRVGKTLSATRRSSLVSRAS